MAESQVHRLLRVKSQTILFGVASAIIMLRSPVIGTIGNSHVGGGRTTLLIQLVGTTPEWHTTYLEMCL